MTDPTQKRLDELQAIQRESAEQLFRMVAVHENALLAHVDHIQSTDMPTQYRQAWQATLDWWQKGEAFNLDRYANVKMPVGLEDFKATVLAQPKIPALPKHAEAAAESLQDASRRLRLHSIGGELQFRALTEQNLDELETETRDRIEGNAPVRVALPSRSEDTAAVQALVKEYHDNPTDIRGMHSTPDFYAIDYVMGGVEQGEYILIAGRPSMGKSTFIGQYACGLAQNGHGGIIFSLEMDRQSLRRRIACSRAGVNSKLLRQGKLNSLDQRKLADELKQMAAYPLWIVDRRGLTIEDIGAIARKAQREHGIKWIAIDTLNKVGDITRHGDNMYFGMTVASLGAANLAGSDGNRPRDELLAVFAAVQMSRDNKARADKRPTLTDLRDSGALEQDADKVISIHRDYYYDKEKADEHAAEVDLLKNRDGSIGNSTLYFEETWPGFRRLARERIDLSVLAAD